MVSGDMASLIDFDYVSQATEDDLQEEVQSLESCLADEPARGSMTIT